MSFEIAEVVLQLGLFLSQVILELRIIGETDGCGKFRYGWALEQFAQIKQTLLGRFSRNGR